MHGTNKSRRFGRGMRGRVEESRAFSQRGWREKERAGGNSFFSVGRESDRHKAVHMMKMWPKEGRRRSLWFNGGKEYPVLPDKGT